MTAQPQPSSKPPCSARPPSPFDHSPWHHVQLPADALAVPTMLTEEEGRLLHWLARDYSIGIGAICDLGCFAGGSTARLASGAAAAGHAAQIHAFDHFTLTEDQKTRYLYPAGIRRFKGKDMQSAVRQFLAPWLDRITLRQGDIAKAAWLGGPIEILFIDAAKTPALADQIARTFMPHLIPGRSIIVHQDYLHWRQPWVPAQMELLAGYCQIVGWCAKNTVLFRPIRPITGQDLSSAEVGSCTDTELIDLIGRAMRRFPARPQRAHLARAIMGVQDNPGIRVPHQMQRSEFFPARVTAVIREALHQR